MRKMIFMAFLLLMIALYFLYPYLLFWTSDIYINEFGQTMSVVKKTRGHGPNVGIMDGVVDYKIEDQYLLVLKMDIIINDTSIIYTGKSQYWAIEYKTGKQNGPFSSREFNRFLLKNKLRKNNLSIPNSYWKYCTKFCPQQNPVR